MPIYEYRCDDCGNEFERLTFAGDDDGEIKCPECGAKKCKRQMSSFASCGEKGAFAGLGQSSSGCGGSGFS
jgi:putative FmdB family regulatory protein